MDKKMIVFDVDGTLSQSRSPIDSEMSVLFTKLLKEKMVAIITGGAFTDIKKQVLDRIGFNNASNKNLTLLPTNGGGLYIFNNSWQEIYSHELTPEEKSTIIKTLKDVLDDGDDVCQPGEDCSGEKIQDRGSQITYSARGSLASVETKIDWDPDFTKRDILENELKKRLPQFEVKIGGKTSIDITQKGMDKAYGMRKLIEYTKLEPADILFIGDAIYENGNDYPVFLMGIDTIKVSGPEETKKIIDKVLSKK